MPKGDRYVTNGALLRCDKGGLVTPLTVLPRPSRVNGQFQANALDCLPIVNIKPFGICAITHGPCLPPMLLWNQVHAGALKVGGAPPLLESSVCQCGLGRRISVTVLPVPGAPPVGPEGPGALAASQEQQRQQAEQDAAAHELANHAKEQAGKLALLGLACAIGGFFFPPLEIVAAIALEASEAYLVAGVAIDVGVALDHPTQDNWVTVGGDALAVAGGYVVGKVVVGPLLGALGSKLAQRATQKAAAETEAALAAEAQQAAEAAAKAEADKVAAKAEEAAKAAAAKTEQEATQAAVRKARQDALSHDPQTGKANAKSVSEASTILQAEEAGLMNNPRRPNMSRGLMLRLLLSYSPELNSIEILRRFCKHYWLTPASCLMADTLLQAFP